MDPVWGDCETEPQASGSWNEKRRVASVFRRLIQRLVAVDAPEGALAGVAERLEETLEAISPWPQRSALEGFAEGATSGNVHAMFDRSPMVGLSNPLSPPMRLRDENGVIRGTVSFGAAYEGPPGHVHGGFIAAAFDEVLGFAQSLTGHPGMTASLNIKYLHPTPLHCELWVEAKVSRIDGRKILAQGQLGRDQLTLAEASGLFVSVDADKIRKLVGKSAIKREAPE